MGNATIAPVGRRPKSLVDQAISSIASLVTATTLSSMLLVVGASAAAAGAGGALATPDPSGVLGTVSARGAVIEPSNPFFQSLGTNGRTCATCHLPTGGWSMTPLDVQARFTATGGLDPVFRTNDGSNSPTADVSTVGARRSAYSMLLGKAVIRVGIGIPAGAEFDLQAVDDPYHFASAQELSLFRRPLPSTNLGFLSTVMWDGRESTALTGTSPVTDMASLQADLGHQATDATNGHAQAAQPPTTDQVQQIVAFEMSLNTAQLRDKIAGSLTDAGATGGPAALAQQPFQIGMNDPLSPGGVSPHTFSVFAAWASLTGADATTQARQAVARGETLFNTKPITISGVAGLNSPTGPASASFQGTCTTCHNTPNVGDHSSALPINIGISDASRRTPDMPVYTLRNKATGETVQTTDPGRALITGKWADIGKFKGPILRGLAARAPYFHNGSAASLDAVLDFYDTRFNIGLSQQEHRDLVAFLRAL